MDGDSHGLSLVTLLVAGVALASYLLFEPLPQSGRPTAPDGPSHINAHSQDIPARLWQDPFDVIFRHRATPSDSGLVSIPTSIYSIPASLEKKCSRFDFLLADVDARSRQEAVLVVPVIVSGGNYPEVEENRRRVRYAVVSGLIRSGYSPEQAGHIGYVIDPNRNTSRDENRHPRHRRQQVYPYEWYQQLGDDGVATKSLLVVWINEDLLGSTPIATFADWQNRLSASVAGASPVMRIIGTFGSGTLTSIATELAAWPVADEVPLETAAGIDGLVILSPTATISENLLPVASGDSGTLAQRWSDTMPNSQLIRITNTDAVLMKAVSTELRGRGINPDCDQDSLRCTHIAIISESDSDYGRSLPSSFIAANEAGSNQIHTFSYLRGLDGRVPGSDAEARPQGPTQSKSKNAQTSFGEARIDYLERMAERLEALDQELKLQLRGRLRAIGVLGTDVYDKLLILQALRHRFPGIVFFTSDLDARLLDPGNFAWTRNLVVASDFGLQLRDFIQGGIPPFRNSYQTSTFLAALLATQEPLTAGPLDLDMPTALTPRIFEIGRGRSFDQTPQTRVMPLDLLTINGQVPTEPTYLHPPHRVANQTDFRSRQWLLIGLIIVLMSAIAFMVITPLQKAVAGFDRIYSSNIQRTLTFSSILLGYLLVVLGAWIFSDTLGEPFSWTGGVSAWPAEIIRLGGGVLAVGLLWRTLVEFEITANYINEEYFTFKRTTDCSACKDATTADSHAPPELDSAPLSGFKRLCRLFCFAPEHSNGEPASSISAQQQWSLYLHRGQPQYRWTRVILPTVLFMAVGYLTINLLTGPPPVPVRTPEMARLDKFIILAMSVLPFLLLLFTVIDSSRSSIALMDALNLPLTQWPETTSGLRWRMINEHGFQANDLDEWLDVRLSADLTQKLGNIVYFPFLIIFMLLISRLTWFDNWTMPAGLIAIISFSAVYAIYCSANLQFAARRVRENACDHLKRRRVQVLAGIATDSDADKRAAQVAQIDVLLDDIKQLKRGAFRPWHQQPVIKAFLLLMSSASIFTLDLLGGP